MSPRQARIGVDVFTALVAASVGVALAGLTWRLMGDPGTRLGASPVAARPAPPVDLAPLIALAPFGAAPAAAGGGLQATDQPLMLRGILLAQPREASTALISVGDSAPVALSVGQSAGNATIAEIAIDHIVLASGGGRSILAFPKAAGSGTAPAAGAASGQSAPAPTSMSSAAPPPVVPSAMTTAAGGAALLATLGATASGTGLSVANPNPAMRMAGLQPGDQIVAINGAAAAEVSRNPALLQPMMAAGTARLDVMRAGQRLTLSVPLR